MALATELEARLQTITEESRALAALVRTPTVQRVPELSSPVLDFDAFDRLLGPETAHG